MVRSPSTRRSTSISRACHGTASFATSCISSFTTRNVTANMTSTSISSPTPRASGIRWRPAATGTPAAFASAIPIVRFPASRLIASPIGSTGRSTPFPITMSSIGMLRVLGRCACTACRSSSPRPPAQCSASTVFRASRDRPSDATPASRRRAQFLPRRDRSTKESR